MTRTIIAGVDGSPGSLPAARYAAEVAQRLEVPLTLIHVFETPMHGYGPLPMVTGYPLAGKQLREAADRMLAQAADEIAAAYPALKTIARVEYGGAAARLIEESRDALMTVVGSRGLGGFAGLMLGSVSTHVATHAHGPVVVVRPAAAPDGPVLTGFDGSEGATAALRFATREALSRKVPLVVANVYWEQPWGLHPRPATDPVIEARLRAERMIADALELTLEEHPELRYEIRTIHSLSPEHSLIEESKHASLTVVGSRGRGGFAGLLLGSVSRTLIHHAAGPLAVIHPTETDHERV